MCIVPEKEVVNILKNIYLEIKNGGFVYIGFCNPLIFDVQSLRLILECRQNTNTKIIIIIKKKKEGNYEIVESHRPIEWYEKEFKVAGLNLVDTIFTPEYELKGRKIKDFAIFKLQK